MIFTELRFLVCFAACWACFFAVPRRWRSAVLAFWGAVVYATFAGALLVVVLVLAGLAYGSGRRTMAWVAGVTTVGLLAYFKLTLGAGPLPTAAAGPRAVLIPLGFSYLAFELLHVAIERRRGRIQELSLPDLLAFALFAPARIAGPIKRYPDFVAAVQAAERSSANVYRGLLRVLVGLAKKLMLADVLALTVAESSYASTPRHAWTILLAFTFQIYLDFSAYSDIAIGFARMLGIELPENFRRPYLAGNIREFWDRWHITLSHWVRDYVFGPTARALFRTRLRRWPPAIAVISYLIAFLTVGAWHGFTAAFLVWGLYHGVLLSIFHLVRLQTPVRVVEHPLYRSRVTRGFAVAVTFACVTLGWVPFMLPLEEARKLLALMFGAGR
jgi:alginate O-acetyltransferase complex protein AlgI